MSRPSRVIVLAEDMRQQRFARQFLYRAGYEGHDLQMIAPPAGRGCGEQWVREQYPVEVKEARRRHTRAHTAEVAFIDADRSEVTDRQQQFANALTAAGVEKREPAELIVHLIPKRSIETWVLCLNGEAVDEVSDYSGMNVDEQIAPAARTFFDWSRPNTSPPANCVPSLISAVPEVRQLPKV